jgi:tetratricopeptide (TPR) repeat protein
MSELEKTLKLARSANADGHNAAAFEMCRRVLALDPSKDGATYSAFYNLLEIGRVSDAERYLNQIRRNAAPKPWLIEVALGQLCLAQFRPIEAEKHFKNAWKLGRNSTAPAVFLADCLSKQEKFDEANSVLIEALKGQDDSNDLEEVYLNLGLVERAKGDYCSARNYLLKAIDIDPDYQDAKRVLADIELCLSLP